MTNRKVLFLQRKPIPNFHFSVEIIFGDVKMALPTFINHKTLIFQYYSQGLLKRLYSCWQAFKHKTEINHVTGDISFVGIALPKKNTVQTILDCVFLESSAGIKRKVLKYFWLTMPVKRAAIVTTISTQVKKEIIAHTNCAEDKVIVVPIALSSLFVHNAKKFDSANPNIIMTGSAPNKNTIRMIEALQGIDCHVTIIGKEEAVFVQKFEECGVSYTYKSGLTQQQMFAEYSSADMLLFASTYEGFGMPIIEAQAVGIPVVTSNISSMPEVAGTDACLVDPYNVNSIKEGVLSLIKDEAYRRKVVASGLDNVKRFDIKNIVQQYITVYNKIHKNATK